MMCGGVSEASKPADAEIQGICDTIREALEGKVDRKFNSYKALHYKSQVVAGTNFFVKIEIDGGSEHIHVRIFKPLPHTKEPPTLHSYEAGKTAEEELGYF